MSYPKLLFFLCSTTQPITLKKQPKRKPKKQPTKNNELLLTKKKERILEARKNNRQRERERERKREREEHRRADATEKESVREMIKLVAAKVPRRLFSSLVLIVFVFSTFFSSSRDEKHHLIVFSSLFTCCFKMKSLGVVALTCLSFSSICAHKNTQKKQAEDAEKRAAAAVKASGQEGPQKSAGEIRLAKGMKSSLVLSRFDDALLFFSARISRVITIH